jgi:hypothetical protein
MVEPNNGEKTSASIHISTVCDEDEDIGDIFGQAASS